MKDQNKFTTAVTETLTKLREDYEATHDELVKIVGYGLDAVRQIPLKSTTPTKAATDPNPVTKPTA